MQETDVLIIGAGPTGTMLALELALQNISCRIVDSAPARSDKSRALVIQPRTLELFARHSIAHDLVALGSVGTGAHVFVHKKLAAELDLTDLGFDDTAFPLPLWISQAETEHFLDAALRKHGVEVERPLTAETVGQDDAGVTVVLRDGETGGEQSIRAQYVVGCDGAHSIVRHAAQIKFEGQGMLVLFPLKDGLFRVVVSTTERKLTAGEDAEPTLEDFQKIWAEMTPEKAVLKDPVWMSRFRLHHRGADRYREGRLFAAGDAAHIHSPAGGQGMNAGIQDAVNPGWKLAAVLHGEMDEKILDSYDTERRRVGEHLLKGTDRALQFGTSGKPAFIFLRNFLVPWVFPWVFSDRGRRAKAFRFMSELGIRYRHSEIVGTASGYTGSLRGGDCAPDATLQGPDGSTSLLDFCKSPGHCLILFSNTESASADVAALQEVTSGFNIDTNLATKYKVLSLKSLGSCDYIEEAGQLQARYGFVEPGYVLIRPDGYIAHIGPLTAKDEFLIWLKNYMVAKL